MDLYHPAILAAMSLEEPQPIGPAIDEALLNLLPPDLLEQYKAEKARHSEEMKEIAKALRKAQRFIRDRFYGALQGKKMEELDIEYTERTQGEMDRHARFLAELKETILDHLHPDRHDARETDTAED